MVKLHGLPKSIVSDRDKVLTSTFWQELFKLSGTQLKMSSAYHPQTNGQAERVNQCLEMFLRYATYDTLSHWAKWLDSTELWYNSCYHSSLKCSPFKALYGVDPYLGDNSVITTGQASDAATILQNRQQYLDMIKTHLAAAQNKMKFYADKNRTFRQFKVGEMLFVKLQPFAQSSVANRPCAKLSFKYFGPFQVVARVGSTAYKLLLPDSAAMHPVFHVSQLKPHVPDHTPVFLSCHLLLLLKVRFMYPSPYWIVTWSGREHQQWCKF